MDYLSGYINTDIISAAACGYFLLIEISVFILQTLEYQNHDSFKGINISTPASIFMDLVYFCSITDYTALYYLYQHRFWRHYT